MKEKVANGIKGFIIADAMGVPVEFKTREELYSDPVIGMREYGTYNQEKGTWSDDSSMTLATMDAIIKEKSVVTTKIAENFLAWRNKAFYTPDNYTFDIGTTTALALTNYERTKGKRSPEECGLGSFYDNGNGSLMRIFPIACWCYYKNINIEDEINLITKVSSITHKNEISIIACYIYVEYIKLLLRGNDKITAYEQLRNLDFSKFNLGNVELFNRIFYLNDLRKDDIKSSGYVVDTLEASIWSFLKGDNYEEAILIAINLGEDTDTIGACTGALAGIYYGYNKNWYSQIKKNDWISNICNQFIDIL